MMMLVRHLLHLQCLLCLLQMETDLVDEKLLSWLWDNPADHAVLFNEKKDTNTQGTSAKPHGWCKKDISTVITHIVFHNDVVYGEIYAKSAEYQWWQAALQCSLKAKYQHHALCLRSTDEGIDPNDSNYQTLQVQHQQHLPNIVGKCNQHDQHDDTVGKHSRDIPLGRAVQLEEEEPEHNDVEHDAEMSGGLQDWQDGPSASGQLPVNITSIDD
ncbi:hypothetical protein J3A83DRAFT_4185478 [Scleroderma citrinum]